jgi:hypothetical protein
LAEEWNESPSRPHRLGDTDGAGGGGGFEAAVGILAAMTMPAAGDPAPDFSLPDQDGNTVSLKDLRGQNVVVYFYPKANTLG